MPFVIVKKQFKTIRVRKMSGARIEVFHDAKIWSTDHVHNIEKEDGDVHMFPSSRTMVECLSPVESD